MGAIKEDLEDKEMLLNRIDDFISDIEENDETPKFIRKNIVDLKSFLFSIVKGEK